MSYHINPSKISLRKYESTSGNRLLRSYESTLYWSTSIDITFVRKYFESTRTFVRKYFESTRTRTVPSYESRPYLRRYLRRYYLRTVGCLYHIILKNLYEYAVQLRNPKVWPLRTPVIFPQSARSQDPEVQLGSWVIFTFPIRPSTSLHLLYLNI
jgi:hypothetical protein